MRLRIFVFLITLAVVLSAGYFFSLIARGYRFDSKTFSLKPRGLFVITSSPNGAQVLINGKLESATNATISLPPDNYNIELKKEGFLTWKKSITIKKEEVTKIEVQLFPGAPSLSALTFTGAINPILASDKTKVAYGIPTSEKADTEKVGIWIMDLADLPIGFSRDPRQITDLDPTNLSWTWSPDSREILVVTPEKTYYLLETGSKNLKSQLLPLTEAKLAQTIEEWREEAGQEYTNSLKDLPDKLKEALKETKITLSPDKNKILYTAEFDLTLPDNIVSPLPGSSTQKEERTVKTGNTYIYDLKEDKNFLVYDKTITLPKDLLEEASSSAKTTPQSKTQTKKPTPAPREAASDVGQPTSISWFPTSTNIVIAEENKITIKEYDGTNSQTVYAGPYIAPHAIPFPNSSRLLILTNLGAGEKAVGNLYGVSLR